MIIVTQYSQKRMKKQHGSIAWEPRVPDGKVGEETTPNFKVTTNPCQLKRLAPTQVPSWGSRQTLDYPCSDVVLSFSLLETSEKTSPRLSTPSSAIYEIGDLFGNTAIRAILGKGPGTSIRKNCINIPISQCCTRSPLE
jgi:hypothetical protein